MEKEICMLTANLYIHITVQYWELSVEVLLKPRHEVKLKNISPSKESHFKHLQK